MLPETILPLRVRDRSARLDFLGPHDHPWLSVLISEFSRFEGRRQRELDRRLKEPCYAPWAKLKSATLILRGLWKSEAPSKLSPVTARSEVFALFRHTLVYGRALGALVPLVAQSSRFSLSATCLLQAQTLTFTLSSGDPLFPAAEVQRFDSRLEERLARDMKRLAPDWDVLREPEAFTASGSLIFPDFLLRHRLAPPREWWVEIVGFWTPEYVSRKLATLRAARIPNLILCIDEERRCSESELPPGSPVIRFRRRIDARSVLRVIDPPCSV